MQDGGAPVHKSVSSGVEAGEVSISASQGVQAGSGNTQVNNFFYFGHPPVAGGALPPDFAPLPENVKPTTQENVADLPRGGNASGDQWPAFSRVPLAFTGLPELGSVEAEVPSWYEDPVYSSDALTASAVQLALLTALGIGPEPGPTRRLRSRTTSPIRLASPRTTPTPGRPSPSPQLTALRR